MSFARKLIVGTLVLFVGIGGIALVKKNKKSAPALATQKAPEKKVVVQAALPECKVQRLKEDDFPDIDRIDQLFKVSTNQLPIVETITYSHSVSWLPGRPAWLADYASHYSTSRHFIARSLHRKPDYLNQKMSEGCKFNVFRKDRPLQFYLLVDATRCKMGLYYVDLASQERVLLKTYKVGLGKLDPTKPSGSLTPLGRYKLGSKIAVYTPGINGTFRDKIVEMIRVFGTRWIPFEQAVSGCTAAPKGYGLHGAPWLPDPKTGELKEVKSCIGAHESDGSISLAAEDMEEIFSIIISKPAFVEIVKDFKVAKLPGVEVFKPRNSI